MGATGGLILTEVAFVVAQVIVVVWPAFTEVGLAVKVVTCGGTGCATLTVTVCAGVDPELPVATALYTVVCVGESATLPDACELLVTVRDAPPAAAVIMTDDAFVVCHDSVTLCPLLIELLLAENVRLGEPDPGFPIACDPQPHRPARRMKTKDENTTRVRKPLDLFMALPTTRGIGCDEDPAAWVAPLWVDAVDE
ncbi:MAG TPA: hypothetical protein VJW20_03360 [Candidatus Angelobacter sp.]|nr:hypothetical protein [Candidatus Angelobacter sp.]